MSNPSTILGFYNVQLSTIIGKFRIYTVGLSLHVGAKLEFQIVTPETLYHATSKYNSA